MTNLLHASQYLEWTEACQTAFDSVKNILSSAPVLVAPRYSYSFKLDVDVSATCVGVVLLQDDESRVEHPFGYFSKTFFETK